SIFLEGERGTIYDRRGRVLATNLEVPSIYAVPTSIQGSDQVGLELARVLKSDLTSVKRRLREDRNFVWIARKVTPERAKAVSDLKIDGIGFVMESQRFYPNRHLMGHLLGFAGMDNQGLEGVELAYDSYLRGEKGLLWMERDALGETIFPSGLGHVAPSRGRDIVLTIDEVIQYITEQELDRVVQQVSAVSGSIIVMNPKTGEILAMAVRPEFNPNILSRHDPSEWRNRAITDLYEPGSTFKIVTAATALEEKLVTPAERINCEEGSFQIGGEVFHDPVKEGVLTFSEVIQRSSNIGTIKIGTRLGAERLYQYAKTFGFGEKTGIDLLGETAGTLRSPHNWSKRSLASIAIGQEVAVTPIQLITAASAVANGGQLMRPYLVSKITEHDGPVIQTIVPELRRRVISQETARQLTQILEGVTRKGGTGEKAALETYSVAGKTGTAQKADSKTKAYSSDRFVSSFVGFVPAEDPEIAILVVVDEPKGVSWGGSVAAPVFKNVAEQTLLYLGRVSPIQERKLVVSKTDPSESMPGSSGKYIPGPSGGLPGPSGGLQ
ncbi:MAG TPA: penicillin-binding protein 2, partial [Nitrospiria bacterium]|nr:penicillin-binding protein 2 [Nitrospiria bacterium]